MCLFPSQKENSEQFNPAYARGIMDSAWFCIVTMSTVGYGDKVPATGIGKAITVFWMLFGIFNFGIFTGQIATQINTFSAEAAISDVNSLAGFNVGILKSTRSVGLASMYQFNGIECLDVKECASMLERKLISAMLVPSADVFTVSFLDLSPLLTGFLTMLGIVQCHGGFLSHDDGECTDKRAAFHHLFPSWWPADPAFMLICLQWSFCVMVWCDVLTSVRLFPVLRFRITRIQALWQSFPCYWRPCSGG